ncbi:hypothetical protein PIB30_002035 [Stylosanthes scabra]|uniref:No apical meristem-associated C-terminal domain-containing protein n=1 Tax=Stylosanthes scabra TaxID=79078 RepID=A0ABU6Q3X4_9FABA|nr:hypothetical protein [Stylosanthes scabra]
MGNMSPTCFQFSSQSSASKLGSGGFDAIDLNDDEIRNQRQRSTPLWQWEEDEMLISACMVEYLNRSYSRTKVTSGGAYSSSSNRETLLAEDADIDSPVHPQGSKKSKRRGKGKAQMSEDLSEAKSSVVKQLSLMEKFKIDREKEQLDEREHREKLIAIKEKELQIQQEMKEQKLQTQKLIKEMEIKAKEREMDKKVLDANLSQMSESTRARHEKA